MMNRTAITAILMVLTFAPMSLAQRSTPSSSSGQGYATLKGTTINVRSKPSTTARVITKVNGGKAKILGQKGEWYYLRFAHGTEGYVRADFLEPMSGSLGGIRVSRSTGASSAENLQYVGPGRTAQAVVDEPRASVTGTGIPVLAGPRDESKPLKTVSSTEAIVLEQHGEWFKLKFADRTVGWVNREYVEFDGIAPKIYDPNTQVTEILVTDANPVISRSGNARVDALINSANRFKGVRYVYGAANRGSTDCSGFTLQVFRANGISLPRTAREQATRGTRVSRGDLEAGDLVFFNTRGRGIGHVGLYIGGNRFIHASSGQGRVVISTLTGYYSNRYVTARRIL